MQPELKTKTSVGEETVDQTVARAKKMIQPTISANELANPPAKVTPPVPVPSTNDGSRLNAAIGNAAVSNQNIITSTSEAAQKRDEIASLLGGQSNVDGMSIFEGLQESSGVNAQIKRREDIQAQIARNNTDSMVRKEMMAGGGQSAIQGERVLNQEDKIEIIKNAGLAAEAMALNGSIESSSNLINQAMSFFYQDRQLNNQNMIQQLNYFSGIAEGETKQLLQREQRAYEADQAKIERTLATVDSALQSGAASPSEIKMLTNPNSTDSERLALAQLIQARGATEMRDLQTQSARMDMAVKAQQLAKLREPVIATRETSVVDVNGTKQLVDTQTGEVIATFGADVSVDEITKARDVNFVNTLDSLKNHPGMNKAVGTTGLARWTPFKADVMTGQVSDFTGSVENVVKQLTLNTYAEAKAKGMTFGAMSEGEWKILASSASKIGAWRRERDDGSIYYDTSESNMNKELDNLSNFGKMDALRKGVSPADIGVLQQADGTYWTKNSNGTYTQLSVTTQ
jgi:hypothetical protein